ncbi:hypothetical protein JJV70_10550 [Streptomyces sp. JJ66]|uniref:hypothetical protein n=1 Tax=Streptomyces sp. JJ66 TaxID=2803843 RepID=UPI001C59C870|nr:hypothetical protein [Streptomyces sp. JJ66]MBW1602539.1 hypothetical protein [Streptomyces sp. JJ66]
MSFDEEWAALHREAVARLKLASAQPAATGSFDLKSSQPAWGKASTGLSELKENLGTASKWMNSEQQEESAGDRSAGALDSAVSHRAVMESWRLRLDLIQRECDEVADKLKKAGDSHYKNEEDVKQAFEAQQTRPQLPSGTSSLPEGR